MPFCEFFGRNVKAGDVEKEQIEGSNPRRWVRAEYSNARSKGSIRCRVMQEVLRVPQDPNLSSNSFGVCAGCELSVRVSTGRVGGQKP